AFQNSSFTGGTVFVQNQSPYSSVDIGTYTYSVVPEPSTYAAIAGALGLGYAVYRRRRQAAATAAA
ncbi:MAG: PEP-CTERM sorting domain-containing protein, partial [Opitutaceae bacterium]